MNNQDRVSALYLEMTGIVDKLSEQDSDFELTGADVEQLEERIAEIDAELDRLE